MRVARYTQNDAPQWDKFVEDSKNGTFLFLRGYMDYHSDRFQDHSLMFYDNKNRLTAIMPANEKDGILYSHQGLTYGGFVLSPKSKIIEVGELFETTIKYLRTLNFTEWHYKQIPTVYHKLPAEEDEYWLWRHGAVMTSCNVMSAIDLQSEIPFSKRKRTYFNKFCRTGYVIDMHASLRDLWPILEQNLMETYKATPVHSIREIEMLQRRFPNNILCSTIKNQDGITIAGTVLYISDSVIRAQYISASREGKEKHALDFLFLSLVEHYSKTGGFRYFEFGTSMNEDGILFNSGLVHQKETLGGRCIACKTYSITL